MSDTGSAGADSSSQTASRDISTSAGDTTSAAPEAEASDVASHPLLAEQPEAVRQQVGAMMSRWNAACDVTSGATTSDDDDEMIQLDVVEVDGGLASSLMPQVRPSTVRAASAYRPLSAFKT